MSWIWRKDGLPGARGSLRRSRPATRRTTGPRSSGRSRRHSGVSLRAVDRGPGEAAPAPAGRRIHVQAGYYARYITNHDLDCRRDEEMNTLFKSSLIWLLAGTLMMSVRVNAQDASPAPFKTEEIEQMVAPIALYPDPLIAQILMASTYPLEVVSAARWAKANPKVQGKELEDAMQKQDWDASVKSLCSFPDTLSMMNDKLDWTQQLGDAFLSQQQDVMNEIGRAPCSDREAK